MANRNYLNFDLLLEQEGEGRYQARVTDSPLGETPSVRFQLPFDATTLENLLLKLDPGRSGTRRVGGTSQQQAAMDFGGPLYQAVFTGDLALAWQRSLDTVRAQQAGGLRLRLRLNDAPAIAGLPWELLYDARTNSFLAQSERTPVVRFLDVPQVPRPIAVDGPLRVLAIISSPTDLEELDVEAEWRRIGDSLAPRVQAGLVVVDRLPSATIADLGAWLRQHETHVIHFVGHGDFDDRLREGVIYFQDQHGRSSPVTSSILGPYLRDHDPLRMVVLNACRSARADAVDPFGGMAQGLVQQDATAVVAMQFPISDRAAVTFTGEFYGALVDGFPVDQAVSSARKSLLADFGDEWCTPVLFLRSPDGNIFENVHALSGGVPPGPVPPVPVPTVPEPLWQRVQAFLRTHKPLVVGGVAAVVLLVLLAVIFLPGGDGDGLPEAQGQDPTDVATETGATSQPSSPATSEPTTTSSSADPTQDASTLPGGTPLSGSQLLVAAGDNNRDLRIYVFDVTTGQEVGAALTGDEGIRDWRPVLSLDRETMVYSRKRTTGVELRAVAIDGSGDQPLFDQSDVKECAESAGRPAWIPGTEEFVVRCFGMERQDQDERGYIRLVRIDVHGNTRTYDKIDGGTWKDFGHPAVSPDGRTAVYPVSEEKESREGTLYMVDLAKNDPLPLQGPWQDLIDYGDPVFSPAGDMLAWRATALQPEGADASEDAGFEILAAPFVDGDLDMDQLVRVSGMVPGADQEPMFSPDGTQIIYGHSPPDDTPTDLSDDVSQELWIASVANPDDRRKLSDDTHSFYSGAAWTRR